MTKKFTPRQAVNKSSTPTLKSNSVRMMVSDGEHSCTDKRKEKQQNNRLSALHCPWMGGMKGGGEESILHLPSAIILLLSSEMIYCFMKEKKKKNEFPHDIL